ncbi:MAG: Penicillin-binding protein 1A [Glaciecola sp. HTCC2999]|nr:MAG: Penicillin-binding protein 1A [Glaciecola sp. HTCC2999]
MIKRLKSVFRSLVVLGVLALTLGLVGTVSLYFYVKSDLPSVESLRDVRLQTPMRIYTQDGQLISQYGVKRRIPVTLEEVPQTLIDAILATEDSRFYEHDGIDPIGMLRALMNLVVTGEKGQGGSTLTMQIARGFYLSREKTYIRKIKEIFIAWHIEQTLTKDEILTLYLNKVELGHRAFGFGAAAQVYYGTTLNELNLAQIATLAGLPQAPSVLNPISRPERSIERRRLVLLRMLDEGYITRQEFRVARDAEVTASKHGAEIEFPAPYLADIIYNEMVELYGKEEAETGGYQVYATVKSTLQRAAQIAVLQNIHDYDERHGYRGVLTNLAELQDTWELKNNLQSGETQPDELQPDESILESESSTQIIDIEMISRSAQLINELSHDRLLELLELVNPIQPLMPAIVISVEERSIEVLNQAGELLTIQWPGLAWARPYINDQRQGPIPQNASDIVQLGDVVYTRLNAEKGWFLSQLPEVSSAFVALDPKDGAIQAIVGGYNFYQSQFNRATQAERQVGSNIKPFVYSAALENGYTIASVINDAPINQWDASSGIAWRPQNSPAVYDGPIRMRKALGKSKNVVSVRLLRAVGIENTARYIARFGFDLDDIPRDETLSLGSGSHTPLEVATGMATFSNGGFAITPYFIERITNDNDVTLYEANMPQACQACEKDVKTVNSVSDESANIDNIEALLAETLTETLLVDEATQTKDIIPAPRVISAQNAFLVSEMLRTAVRANGSWNKKTYWLGTGWRARNILQRTDIGGKTGTTNDSRDTWFSGFAPGLVATSWMGFDDNARQLGRTTRNQHLVNMNPEKFNWIGNGLIGSEDGAKAAQPAWIRFMQIALANVPQSSEAIPEGITQVRIDRTTGKLTDRTDHTSMFEYFAIGTQPTAKISDSQVIDPLEEEQEAVTKEGDDIF